MRLVNFALLLGASVALLWYGVTAWEQSTALREDDSDIVQ